MTVIWNCASSGQVIDGGLYSTKCATSRSHISRHNWTCTWVVPSVRRTGLEQRKVKETHLALVGWRAISLHKLSHQWAAPKGRGQFKAHWSSTGWAGECIPFALDEDAVSGDTVRASPKPRVVWVYEQPEVQDLFASSLLVQSDGFCLVMLPVACGFVALKGIHADGLLGLPSDELLTGAAHVGLVWLDVHRRTRI